MFGWLFLLFLVFVVICLFVLQTFITYSVSEYCHESKTVCTLWLNYLPFLSRFLFRSLPLSPPPSLSSPFSLSPFLLFCLSVWSLNQSFFSSSACLICLSVQSVYLFLSASLIHSIHILFLSDPFLSLNLITQSVSLLFSACLSVCLCNRSIGLSASVMPLYYSLHPPSLSLSQILFCLSVSSFNQSLFLCLPVSLSV